MKIRNFFAAMILLASSALFGQVYSIGGLNCSNIGGGSSSGWVNGPNGSYAIVQCLYSFHPDTGHGTFHISSEVGTSVTGDYTFNINFPLGITVSEMHGGVEFVSWCAGNNGFLFTVNGLYPGSQTESMGAFKDTITGPAAPPLSGYYVGKTHYNIKADWKYGVAISSFYLNHFVDGCSIGTFNVTMDGSF